MTGVSRREASWPALDLFRGIAAVAMVANHAAVRWCEPVDASWVSSGAFLLGGLAPVLFFFATGFGSGVQHAARAAGEGGAHRYGFLRKVLVLCAADQFVAWERGAPGLGVDFLGFIGLSTLALEPLRRARRGVAIAGVLLALVLVARFALPAALDVAGAGSPLWARLTGRSALPWLSYPPLPWLAFPLLGFVLGAEAERRRARLSESKLALACLAAGVLGCAASVALASAGLRVNRYGTMTLAYLPFALGGIALAASAAVAGLRTGSAGARALALRGLPSLLLVPVHFWLLSLLEPWVEPAGAALFAVALAGAVAAALALSRALAARATRLAAGPHAGRLGAACLGLGALTAAAVFFTGLPNGGARSALVFAAQTAVCLLLVLPLGGLREAGAAPRALREAER